MPQKMLLLTFSLLFMTDLNIKFRTRVIFSVILHKPVCFNIDCTEFENHQSFETVSDLEIAVIAE